MTTAPKAHLRQRRCMVRNRTKSAFGKLAILGYAAGDGVELFIDVNIQGSATYPVTKPERRDTQRAKPTKSHSHITTSSPKCPILRLA